MNRARTLIALVAILCAVPAMADVYSLDAASETLLDPVLDAAAGDILTSGPNGHVWMEELGLDGNDDLNALSAGLDIITGDDILYFSVSRTFAGAPGTAVNAESLINEQAGDIFVTVNHPVNGGGIMVPPTGDNSQVYDQTGKLGTPGFGLLGDNKDNINAYSQDEFNFASHCPGHDVPVYFSLKLLSQSLPNVAGASADDILVSNPDIIAGSGTFGIYKDGVADIGLKAGDDLDALALEILDLTQYGGSLIEEAYFSLAPNSPTLYGPDNLPNTADDYSAADIFYTNFNGTFVLAYTAASLGLFEGDDVDALETNAYVPEPATMVILGLGGIGVLLRRRRK